MFVARRWIYFLAVGFMLLGVGASAQDMQPLFTPLSDKAAVEHGSQPWEKGWIYTDPGAVIYHDGLFHMFRNAFKGWPPTGASIDYMTSPDGIAWTEVNDAPVIVPEDVPFGTKATLAASVLVEDDGTWVLYFYTWTDNSGSENDGVIGRATAKDPFGPWTVDAEPVLKPGSAGSWDENLVISPYVVKTETGYSMYFNGYDSRGLAGLRMGMATSPDGIVWTKYDDPATTDAPFAESDPILAASEDWEQRGIGMARVHWQANQSRWLMFYRASSGSALALGIATSTDGLHWDKQSEPVFHPEDVPGQGGIWTYTSVLQDDTFYLFTELSTTMDASTTNIFVVKHEGDLP